MVADDCSLKRRILSHRDAEVRWSVGGVLKLFHSVYTTPSESQPRRRNKIFSHEQFQVVLKQTLSFHPKNRESNCSKISREHNKNNLVKLLTYQILRESIEARPKVEQTLSSRCFVAQPGRLMRGNLDKNETFLMKQPKKSENGNFPCRFNFRPHFIVPLLRRSTSAEQWKGKTENEWRAEAEMTTKMKNFHYQLEHNTMSCSGVGNLQG